jgi:hypothetical protein
MNAFRAARLQHNHSIRVALLAAIHGHIGANDKFREGDRTHAANPLSE